MGYTLFCLGKAYKRAMDTPPRMMISRIFRVNMIKFSLTFLLAYCLIEGEQTIELEAGAKSFITTPYRHPKKFKDEIEKTI